MSMVEFGDNLDADEEYDVLQSILDFPMECLEEDEHVEDWDVSNLDCLGPIPPNVLMGPPLIPNESFNIRPPNVFPRPVSLIAGVPELEQQPKHVDISGLTIPPQRKHAKVQCGSFHTQSPVSVLESKKSLCAKSDNTIPVRSRSKRVRYVGVNPWLKQTLAGKRIAKRCAHCQSTDTPQWRLGPLGPNTLCNACGVRYRSGRLFPEYRPAASPMFVQSQHSNIHRKVVEMRGKVKQPSSPNIKATVEEPPLGLKMKAKALELPISQPEFVHNEKLQITRAPKDVLPPHKAGAPKQIWLAKHIESSGSSSRKKNLSITSTKMKCKKPSLPNKAEERTKKSFHSLEASNPSHSSKPWHGLIKKCAHCQSTKTPQWREGPLGPRTLCNACGVRYKSGRLHPEYRPAASPTFMASKHSNLHKQVIQMIEAGVTTEVPLTSPHTNFVL